MVFTFSSLTLLELLEVTMFGMKSPEQDTEQPSDGVRCSTYSFHLFTIQTTLHSADSCDALLLDNLNSM